MLDQFEEFFLYHEQNRSFVEELADVIRRPDLRVNVLIGIREDALALLDAFKAVIPNLLSNRLRLENLDRAAGEAAIRGPLERFNELVPAEAPGRPGNSPRRRCSRRGCGRAGRARSGGPGCRHRPC